MLLPPSCTFNMIIDPHGDSIPGLHVWRILVRLLYIHRSFAYKHALAGNEANSEAKRSYQG